MRAMDDSEMKLLDAKSGDNDALVWKQVMSELNLSSPLVAREALEAAGVQSKDAGRTVDCLEWLGVFDDTPVEKRGTMVDSLCALLEKKLSYQAHSFLSTPPFDKLQPYSRERLKARRPDLRAHRRTNQSVEW